jgi:hypothetical protein
MEWSFREEVREVRSCRVSGRMRWVAVDMIVVFVVVVGKSAFGEGAGEGEVDMIPIDLERSSSSVVEVSRFRVVDVPTSVM